MTRDELAAELEAAGIDELTQRLRFLATADYVLTLLSAAEARGREDALCPMTDEEVRETVNAADRLADYSPRTRWQWHVAFAVCLIGNRRDASRRASQPVVAVDSAEMAERFSG